VVGWYRTSARAGQPGNTVLSGHVDWGTNTAVFWGLRRLVPGDTILVRGADDVQHTYSVEFNRVFARDDASAVALAGGSSGSMLTLITCDGVYDRSTQDYSGRRIVRASLSE
jgi:LPXTG-site transpeptidase (sortase) family protein